MTVEWFFGLNAEASAWFGDMVRVAIRSARANTRLQPHCLFDGPPNTLTDWLVDQDVAVHFTGVPFRDELGADEVMERNAGSPYTPEHAAGAFLRLIAHKHATSAVFLYTDCDVMFLGPGIETLSTTGIACVEETDEHGSFNSGVMLVARDFMGLQYERLVGLIRSEGFYARRHRSFDQVFLNRHFGRAWDRLPPRFNWRPWQGIHPDARIVHFHGPKPTRIRAILEGRSIPEELPMREVIVRNLDAYRHYQELFEGFLSAD